MVSIILTVIAFLLSGYAMYLGKVDYAIYGILVAILLELEHISNLIKKWTSQ